MIEQAKDALGDDVALDFIRAAIDRLRLAREPVARMVDFVRAVVRALPAEPLAAHDLDQKLGAILIHPDLRILHDRGDCTWSLVGPRIVVHALNGEAHRGRIHHVVGDAGAQIRIGDAALRISPDIMLGDFIQRTRVGAAEACATRIAALAIAFELQEALADGPAAIERTHQVFLGHFNIGEEGFAERRVAADQLDRTRFDAGRLHVDQEKRNAFVLPGIVGTHEAEAPVGILRPTGPDLLTVDEKMIAFVDGLGTQAREIGTGARFGIALAPAHRAVNDARHVTALLFFVAVFQKRGPEHRRAHAADRIEGADAVHFLHQYARFSLRQTAAAILFGPGRYAPALLAHRLLPFQIIRIGRAEPFEERERIGAFQRRWKIPFQPLARFVAEVFQSGIDNLRHESLRLLMIHQTEDALGDDVEVLLRGAALDRIALGAQHGAHRRDLARLVGIAVPAERLRAQRLDQKLGALLVYLRGGVFDDRRGGGRPLALLGYLFGATHRHREGARFHLVRRDARPEIAVRHLAVDLADIVERGMFEIIGAATAATETAGRDILPLVLQESLGDIPAAIEFSDELLLRHLHIGEEGFAEWRLSRDQLDRPRLHARRRHVEEQERDPFVLLAVVGAHQTENPVRLVGIRRPDLLAVDEIMITLVNGLGTKARKVGTRARFGIALAPADFALHDAGEKLLLLFLARIFEQNRPQHPDAERHQRRARLQTGEFLCKHPGFGVGEPAAAIFLGPGRCGPTLGGHAVEPELLFRILELGLAPAPDRIVVVVFDGGVAAHRRRAIGVEPATRFASEGLEIAHRHHPTGHRQD